MPKTSPKHIEFQTKLGEAVSLRLAKVPYDEIIKTLGHWNSISACQKAVSTYLRNNQTKIVEDSRAESIAILEDNILVLRAKFKKSKSTLIAREIRNQLREINLLQGNYAPTKLAHEGKDGDPEIKTGVRVILPPEPSQ